MINKKAGNIIKLWTWYTFRYCCLYTFLLCAACYVQLIALEWKWKIVCYSLIYQNAFFFSFLKWNWKQTVNHNYTTSQLLSWAIIKLNWKAAMKHQMCDDKNQSSSTPIARDFFLESFKVKWILITQNALEKYLWIIMISFFNVEHKYKGITVSSGFFV